MNIIYFFDFFKYMMFNMFSSDIFMFFYYMFILTFVIWAFRKLLHV